MSEHLLQPSNYSNPPPAETTGFQFNHTMIRVKDPKVSIDFYTRVLGMTFLSSSAFEFGKFSLYFLGYPTSEVPRSSEHELSKWMFTQNTGLLELTHNWGTENDSEFKYHNGNNDPRGFG